MGRPVTSLRGGRRRRGLGPTLAALALAAAPAQAATVRISNLSDATFTGIDPMAAQASIGRLCVYSTTGRYRVTATGSGTGGAFSLTAGAGLDLPYGLQWSDSPSASTGTALTPGAPLTGLTTTYLTVCVLGAMSATLIVNLSPSDMQAAVAGVTYSGVVTLLVAPE